MRRWELLYLELEECLYDCRTESIIVLKKKIDRLKNTFLLRVVKKQ